MVHKTEEGDLLVGKLLDTLLVFELADEKVTVVLGYDISVETNDYDLFLLHGVHHAIAALIESDVLTDGYIA